jgi:hypothetical protein
MQYNPLCPLYLALRKLPVICINADNLDAENGFIPFMSYEPSHCINDENIAVASM